MKLLKLYKVERTDMVGYDEYDSAIIVAESEEHARTFGPSSEYPLASWSAPPESLKVTLIGRLAAADIKAGSILGSFNAG